MMKRTIKGATLPMIRSKLSSGKPEDYLEALEPRAQVEANVEMVRRSAEEAIAAPLGDRDG